MEFYASVALGGALGALTRYAITIFFQLHYSSSIPWGTIFANVVGSFLMGVLFIILQEKFAQNDVLKGLLAVGFLGALTTFSSFSLETLIMLQKGNFTYAFGYVIASVGLCLMAAYIGLQVARSWF
jgi:CrcB protein